MKIENDSRQMPS